MKLSLKPQHSDVFISIYVLLVLYLRFKFENNNHAISQGLLIVFELCSVAFLWSLIKLKILNPNWFGLFKKPNKK